MKKDNTEDRKIIRIPQVLFIGNGLIKDGGGLLWEELLREITVRTDLPHELRSPMSLKCALATGNNVENILKNNRVFYGKTLDDTTLISRLLKEDFKQILTTNYSYELEDMAYPGIIDSKSGLRKIMCNIKEFGKPDQKYLLSTYNVIEYERVKHNIWHIHGEARKPGSIVINNYSYGKLLSKYIEILRNNSNRYCKEQETQGYVTANSWLDYFVLGDVYIIGFGFDYSEIDLWWLIERKSREKAKCGKVYFYDIGTVGFNEKHELLKMFGCEVRTCGYIKRYGTEVDYKKFYKDAIQDIIKTSKSKKGK